jgi:hypothetical protein
MKFRAHVFSKAFRRNTAMHRHTLSHRLFKVSFTAAPTSNVHQKHELLALAGQSAKPKQLPTAKDEV